MAWPARHPGGYVSMLAAVREGETMRVRDSKALLCRDGACHGWHPQCGRRAASHTRAQGMANPPLHGASPQFVCPAFSVQRTLLLTFPHHRRGIDRISIWKGWDVAISLPPSASWSQQQT